MLDISYEIWEEAYKRNIRPLPIWLSCEDVRKKQYREFIHDYKQRQLDWESEDPGEEL